MQDDPRAIWTRIAPWWDQSIGEGNEFQLQLIMPATDRLLAPRPGDRILDVACGNGNYARRLARAGARVTACDVAEPFLEAARRRTPSAPPTSPSPHPPISYEKADATDESKLLALAPPGTFDAAVCSMALMDLPTLDPLLRALRTLLNPATGRFVFSIPHPCFNSAHARMTAELINEDGRLQQTYGVSLSRYIHPTTDLSSGILNQPEPHYLYHRPLSQLVTTFATHGFVIDALEEPTFPSGKATGTNAFSWKSRPQLPPALVARLVRLPRN